MSSAAMSEAALSLAGEALLGYPPWLYRRIGHPVSWIGAVIAALSARLNRPGLPDWRARANGVATAVTIAACGAGFGLALSRVAGRSPLRRPLLVLLATPGLAQRSLHDHVAAVSRPLAIGDLAGARRAVGQIVGRDVEALDRSGVAAAALESLAESFNDGVVAPALWLALAGLPGLYAYKAINTADSLIGHKEPPWREFGWAAARLDDAVNLVPARIAGALVALAGGGGWRVMWREAGRHASPNAGWPEAAMAGALNLRLGGPATYDGGLVDRPVFSAGSPAPSPAGVARGLALYRRACLLLFAGLALCALAPRRRR
jgi:adenosylcobinamide-phosphate synthase